MARKRIITLKNSVKHEQSKLERKDNKKTWILADEEVSPIAKRKVDCQKLQTIAIKHVINIRQDVCLKQLSL